MNRLHALTKIQRHVFESGCTDEKDIFLALRHVIPNGGDTEVLSRKEIESFAKISLQQLAEARFPVERERLRLDILEGELRADLLDEIAKLDLSNPRDCRELYELHRAVGNSTGEPTLRQAIDALAVGGTSEDVVAALTERLLALYPAPAGDE